MKKYSIFSIILSLVLTFSIFNVGCNNKDEKDAQKPEQKVYSLLSEDISILVGYEYLPNLTLTLNGEPIEASILLTSENSEYVSVNNGKLKAEKLGESKITAIAKIGAKEVARTTFNCEVQENKGIHPLKNSFVLYISDNVKGVPFETSTELSALVYENGEIISDADILWEVGDNTIASIEGNKLKSLSVGETYVVGTYSNAGTQLKTLKLDVKVEIPVLDSKQDVIVDKNNEIQVLDAQEILGEEVIGSFENLNLKKEYQVEDNKVKTSLFKSGEHTCIFYDQDKTIGVKVSLFSADYVVYDNQDLLTLTTLTDGYIVLANDLSGISYSNTAKKAFKGVFNGLGHTISDIKFISSTGLFYNTDGATIKNVSVKNAIIQEASSGVFFYRNQGGETIVDNTYVSVTLIPGIKGAWDSGGVFAFVFGGKVIYSNSIVNANGFNGGGHGLVLSRAYSQVVITNSFAIGNGTVCGTSSNQYNKNFEAINRMIGVKYETQAELVEGINKGKTDFSGFNKYWDKSSDIPIM